MNKALLTAVLVGSFTYPNFPQRDLAIQCGNGVSVYGDTYGGLGWRPNTATINGEAINGDLAIWMPDGDATASVPSSCITIGGVEYIWYTDVTYNTDHDFVASSSGIVLLSGEKFRLFEGDGDRAQATFAHNDGTHTYMFFTGAGRTGAATLARSRNLLDASSYEWFTGEGWGDFSDAVPIIGGQVGEASVCFDGANWRIAYLDPSLNGVVERRSSSLQGGWSDPIMLVNWNNYHGTYAPQWTICGREFLLSSFERTGGYPSYNVHVWRIQ